MSGDWRPARSLPVLHKQLQAATRAAPPATGADEWGLRGDALHDLTSDHTPRDFLGWGTQIVTAADFPNRPDLGLDAHAVLDAIRASRDPRAKYGISNGEIFSNHATTQGGVTYAAWTWRPYRRSDGSRYPDEHYTHGHLSVVGDSRADGEQPWAIGGDNDMDLNAIGGIVPGISNGQVLHDIWVWMATDRGLVPRDADGHPLPRPDDRFKDPVPAEGGEPGPKGDKGDQGDPGAAAVLAPGTMLTVAQE